MEPKELTNLTVRLPKGLKREAKAKAAQEETTLTRVVNDWLKIWLTEQGQAQPPPKNSH